MRGYSVIILSAGVGRRFQPLSYKYHKSLIPITGRPNLLRTIDIVGKYAKKIVIMTNENSCGDHIDVVRKSHYMAKTTVKINPEAFTTNTVTSFLRGLNELSNSDLRKGVLIVEGDQLYKVDELTQMIKKWNHRKSAYFTQDRENEWAVEDDGSKQRKVKTVYAGGCSGMCMAGVAFLSKKDALSAEQAFYNSDTLNKSMYYESVVEFCRNNGIFDVYNNYSSSSYSREYDNLGDLCDILGQTEFLKLFDKVRPTDSMTNNTFKVTIGDTDYILKIPGAGTDMFIDRRREEAVSREFSDRNVAPCSYKSGYITIVDYIKHGRILKPTSEDMVRAAKIIARVHNIPTHGTDTTNDLIQHPHYINWCDEFFKYIRTMDKYNPKYHQDLDNNEHYRKLHKYVMDVIYENHSKKVYCQVDLVPNNIIVTKGRAKIIDHEYSGITNRYWDLGSFLTEMFIFYPTKMNWDLANVFIQQYSKSAQFSTDLEEVKRWMTVVDFIWGVWGYAKTAAGQDYLAYGKSRLLTAYQRSYDDIMKRYKEG